MLSTKQNRKAAMLLLGHPKVSKFFPVEVRGCIYCVFGLPEAEGVVDEEDELVYGGVIKLCRRGRVVGLRRLRHSGQWLRG